VIFCMASLPCRIGPGGHVGAAPYLLSHPGRTVEARIDIGE